MSSKSFSEKFRFSLTACLLLLLLLWGAFLLWSNASNLPALFRNSYASARPENPGPVEKLSTAISAAETAVDRTLNQHTELITLFGGLQRLIGNDVVRDSGGYTVVRMKNGKLTFLDSPSDPAPNAALLNDFAAYNHSLGVHTLYVTLPNKVDPNADQMPTGSFGYGNGHGDQFLELLDPSVGSLDLRECFQTAERPYDDYFFDTDHHWTPEGAFLGFQCLCQELRDEYGFAIDPELTDPDHYERVVYENWFLGSQGKRVGPLYAGVDDFVLWLPKGADSGYRYRVPHKDLTREGGFEDAFLFYEMLEKKDYYHLNPYAAYSGGDYPLSIAENQNPGSGKRVLLLRQSFSCTLAPFLAQACARLDILDLRYYKESVRDYVEETRPDLVILAYGAGDCVNEALFAPLAG